MLFQANKVSVSKALITTDIAFTFFDFHNRKTLYINSLYLFHFSSSFFSTQGGSNEHDGSINWHLPVFFSTTVITGRWFSNFFSVCAGKSHKILHFFVSSNFIGYVHTIYQPFQIPIFYKVSNELPLPHFHVWVFCNHSTPNCTHSAPVYFYYYYCYCWYCY